MFNTHNPSYKSDFALFYVINKERIHLRKSHMSVSSFNKIKKQLDL